jgi:6-hydroxycyclohex-1-ene-1-carbonyl-CoA dehydrogenase
MPGNDIQGGFATHIVVPGRGLCEVDQARLGRAGLTLADVSIVADALTTPYQAVRRAGVAPGSLAVVVGAGGVGGYCVQMANAFGAKVVAIDVDTDKLAAIAAHGAALTLDARAQDGKAMKAAISAFAKQNGLRATEWFIFECSGTAAGQLTAYSLLVHGATLSVVGFTMDKVELRLSNLMAFDARAIGNWGCPPEFYPAALDLVLDGRVSIKPFVEPHPLDDINRVFAAVHHREIKRRAVLVPAHRGSTA